MSNGDAYAWWDAAYVLGALSAKERQEFEEHLAGCPACRKAVAELAGLPGLLAQVPAGEVLAMDDPGHEPPPPRSLMPELPTDPRADRSRSWWRRYALPAAAAAALLIGGLGGYVLGGGLSEDTSTVSPQATRVAFSPVTPSTITAVMDVVPSVDGTAFRVECQYGVAAPSGEAGPGAWDDYAIYIVDRSGNAVLAKTWKANPERVMRPTASSHLPVSQIAAVEIRAVDSGRTLVRAQVN